MSAVVAAQEPSACYVESLEHPLVRHFNHLAAAPDGVARLRELILALAVRGKLERQDPNEEPATELLALARAARQRLIEAGELRRSALVPPVSDREQPFDLPPGWTWARIGEVGQVVGGGTPKSDVPGYWAESGVPWLTPADLYGYREMTISRGRRDISPKGLTSSSAQLLPAGSVLFSSRAPIGYVAIAGVPMATNQGFKSCVPFVQGVNKYLFWHLRQLAPQIDASASGTTFKEISGADFASVAVALPPLAEQARIVARVDELMRLCDALEEKGRLEAEQHARLLSTLLGTLTDSATPEDLAANWRRVAEHFDLLLDRPEGVGALSQALAQLAVRGLLTMQSATDEPAASFVSSVNAGRTARRASTAVKPLASVDQQGLPAGWCLTNVGSVAECLDYLRRPVKKAEREGHAGNVPYYGANGQVGWIGEHLFDEDLVLVVEDETFIGRTKPFSYVVRGKSWVNNHAHVLRPLGGMSADYLDLCLQRYDFIPLTSGTTNRRKLTQPGLLNAEFMLAPLAEQARIVARVTELRRLCATLRERLQAQQATQSCLAEALVEQAVAG